jgi:ParB-like chromosome segregation protein Spo0J
MIEKLIEELNRLPLDEKIEAINKIREELHAISPFKDNPVDFVRWVKNDLVQPNDYNPNKVAPPEMELLYLSIKEDGYTQPIVAYREDGLNIVVDGFHRHRVGKEKKDICDSVHGYLPITEVNPDREGKDCRIASTIRHNRARGKHTVDGMSGIVLELSRRNWNDKKISKELGLDMDEVLRLKQISGLADAFADQEFSEAWEAGFETEN